ncbi:MAG: Lrp/AsnC family transcriptional regulator [Eubacterium sp.]|nr:Lrp/AsnC family transcriptional regulator [Eubacterium sp.]
MDSLDYKILECLKDNARVNATAIGAKINLSTSAVIERIKKLESTGILKKYTILVDHKLLGRELTAFIYVRLDHPKYYENFVEVVKNNDSVAECYYIAGDFDFILKVITKTGHTLEDVLNSIKSINGVSLTRTSVVLSTNKHDICLLEEK